MLCKTLSGMLIGIILIFSFNACQSGPKPIEYGVDACAHCKMLITDSKYGGEIVTTKGKILEFDAIECLAEYYLNKKLNKDEIKSMWVVNFSEPAKLIDAKSALYLKNDSFHSPMGLNVLAVQTAEELNKLMSKYGGEKMNWDGVLSLVKSKM